MAAASSSRVGRRRGMRWDERSSNFYVCPPRRKGLYFESRPLRNFSTTGQWLWDEIHLNVPSGGDPYEAAHKIGEIVERETRADAAEATKDWERVTQRSR